MKQQRYTHPTAAAAQPSPDAVGRWSKFVASGVGECGDVNVEYSGDFESLSGSYLFVDVGSPGYRSVS